MLETPIAPLNLTLGNGQKIYFHSDESIEADDVPIIDISGIYIEHLEERKAVAEKVGGACHRIGFFYIINHGVEQKYVDSTFEQAKRFFALPTERKMEVCTNLVPEEFFGYFPMATYNRNYKKKKDLMEAYNWSAAAYLRNNVADIVVQGLQSQVRPGSHERARIDTDAVNLLWLKDLPGFKETLYEHHAQLLTLARRMVKTFALALHLEEDCSEHSIPKPSAAMRITHYPQQDVSRFESYHNINDQKY